MTDHALSTKAANRSHEGADGASLESFRSALLVAALLTSACDSYVDPVGRSYATCATDADCDRAAPECRLFQLANGVSARWCTKECEYSEDCHDNVDISLGISGCSPFTEDGVLDYDNGTIFRCRFECIEDTHYCPYEGQTCLPMSETSLSTVCVTPLQP